MCSEYQELLSRITKGKKCLRSQHFALFCEEASSASSDAPAILSLREDALTNIANYLGVVVSLDTSITLVLYQSPQTKTQETGHMGNGWAFDSIMIEVYNEKIQVDPYHELVHIIAGRLGEPPAIFDEGLAVYLATTMWRQQATSELYAQALRVKDESPSLTEIIDFTEIGPSYTRPEISYVLSGAFIAYLIEADKQRFLELYRRLRSPSDPEARIRNKEVFESAMGESLDSVIEQFWRVARGASTDQSVQ